MCEANIKESFFISREDFFDSQSAVLIKCLKENVNFHDYVPQIINKLSAGIYVFDSLEIDIISKCCNKFADTFSKNSRNYSLYYLLFALCSSVRE